MIDLIDRQALIKALHTWDMQDLYLPVHFQRLIEEAPTVELKRGEWEFFVEKSFNGEVVEVYDYGWRCSHCKTPLADTVGGYWDDNSEKPTVNYCPNCGADMRGN